MAEKRFNGRIALDVRDAKPDWEPYKPAEAKESAPNILYIVWDDVGFGAFDCYGGMIETPNVSRIANRGLRYTNFHTTALLSADRAQRHLQRHGVHHRGLLGLPRLQRAHSLRERPPEIAKITLDGIYDRRGRSLQLKQMHERSSKEATEMEGPKDLRGQWPWRALGLGARPAPKERHGIAAFQTNTV